MTTNDLTKLVPDHGIQTVIVNEKARIIDVVMVLQGNDEAMLLGSQGTSTQITSWLKKYVITDDVRFADQSSQNGCIEIMGPRSAEVVEGMFSIDCSKWSLGQWARIDVDGQSATIVRMPSPCEVSYWIVAENPTIDVFREVLTANAASIPMLELDDYEYLRVLSGMGAYDHELSEAYNPLEAGLLHLTSFTKGCYIGQEVIARLDSYNKVKQRIMVIVSQTEMHEGDVVMRDATPVGVITTVALSCDSSASLALAYVRGEHAVSESSIQVASGDIVIEATQYLPPYVDPSCQ
jgi:folate-binding protein YgfZ